MIFLLQSESQNTLTIKTRTLDSVLIGMILEGVSQRDRALKEIYTANKQKVCSFILANSGSEDEAKDVYQESVMAFYENVRDKKFKGESAISTYLYSIAKFKWLNQIKKNQTRSFHHESVETEMFSDSPLASIIDNEKKEMVQDVLERLGSTCKSILIASIYYNASMKEIVENGDFSSEQVVRNKKYKCIKKLRELVSAEPTLMKLLRGYE